MTDRRLLPTLALLGACTSAPPPAVVIEPDAKPAATTPRYAVHLGAAWFPARAAALSLPSPQEAHARDERFSAAGPLPGFWDPHLAVEAAAIWSALCNDCHGGRRRIADAVNMPPPPPDWGTREGFFFGRQRRYDQIYDIIHDGGPHDGEASEMPAWSPRLSREQIWALIYYVEYQSGGKRGEFPPGLYPQRMNAGGLDDGAPPDR